MKTDTELHTHCHGAYARRNGFRLFHTGAVYHRLHFPVIRRDGDCHNHRDQPVFRLPVQDGDTVRAGFPDADTGFIPDATWHHYTYVPEEEQQIRVFHTSELCGAHCAARSYDAYHADHPDDHPV